MITATESFQRARVGGVWGMCLPPPPQQKRNFAIYGVRVPSICYARMITATEWLSSVQNVGGVRGVLTYVLTPTPVPSPSRKVIFFSSHVFLRVCAYLPTGFAVYRMVLDHKQTFDGTLTTGLRYRQHLTV